MRRASLLSLLVIAAWCVPASAHTTDPRIATVVDEVRPALPAGVVVQTQVNVATQLVVSNPAPTVLEVVAPDGEPFLRISSAGVFADLASPFFYATADPGGGGTASRPGPPRFVRISAGSSWGWYDHRLHPTSLTAPRDASRTARLGSFEVPMRYGSQPVTVRGHLEFRPLLGQLQVRVDPAPAGLTASVLQGRLPGLLLRATAPVTVLGRDGEPFLRFSGTGVEVNVTSRTHIEDQRARGLPAGPPSATPRWKAVGGGSYSWLDARLRYGEAQPPAYVVRRLSTSVVDRWSIPLVTAAGSAALTGDIVWVPERVAAGIAPTSPGGSRLPLGLGLGAVAVLVAGVLVVRQVRR